MWFTLNPVGRNTLGNTMKNLCKKAGIEGHLTNRSLVLRLQHVVLKRGLRRNMSWREPAIEMSHRHDETSLHRYQRPNAQQKIEISRAFDLSSSHEESHLDYAEVSNIKNVIDCSKKEVETLNSKDKVKLCKNEKSETTRSAFNNCTFFVQHDFLA